MKKVVFFIVILFSTYIVNAQENNNDQTTDEIRTLFGNVDHVGGYGAFDIGYSTINDKDGMYLGGSALLILNHNFGIGLKGHGFLNASEKNTLLNDGISYSTTGGYGGLLLEPIFFAKNPIHLSVPILIGGGGITYSESNNNHNNYDNDWHSNSLDSKAFFIVEPGVELEFNVVRNFRIGLGCYFRLTSDTELSIDVTQSDNSIQKVKLASSNSLNGAIFGINFKWGIF